MTHGDLGGRDLAWDSSLMGRILGGMVYEDSCGRVWPCISGDFHDFCYRSASSTHPFGLVNKEICIFGRRHHLSQPFYLKMFLVRLIGAQIPNSWDVYDHDLEIHPRKGEGSC